MNDLGVNRITNKLKTEFVLPLQDTESHSLS